MQFKRLLTIILFSFFNLSVLSVLSQDSRKSDVKTILKSQISLLHISQIDFDNAIVTNNYTESSSGLQYVYLQQTWHGIKVFNRILSVTLKKNAVVYVSGKFIDSIQAKAGSYQPVIKPIESAVKAAAHLQLPLSSDFRILSDSLPFSGKVILSPDGIAKRNIISELIWISTDEGKSILLAWNVNIDVLNSSDWWNVRIDAVTGFVINKDNWTVHELNLGQSISQSIYNRNNTQSKTNYEIQKQNLSPPGVTDVNYKVVPFPDENLNIGSLAIDSDPWLKAGAGNNAISYGWHYDGSNDYTITRGNNVFAYEDTTGNDLPGYSAPSSSGLPSLNFNFTPDFTKQPQNINNLNLSLSNLFYWNNLLHDISYQYGFTEPAGNYQNDNLGRGGSGGDYVNAQAEDGSGMDNANFTAPTDGISGRMRMYLWNTPPILNVSSPLAIAGNYSCREGTFSINNSLRKAGPVSGQLVYFNDDNTGTNHLGCSAAFNAASLSGKIALINRGTCNFTVKVRNAQNAGATGVIMVNNVAGPPIVMGGTDNSVTIPAVMISQADGAVFAGQLGNNIMLSISAGVNIDGALDDGIMAHEYTHGISIRLTGGPANSSCLNNAEQAGEGWSDYMALMVTTNWPASALTDGTISRTIGTYALNQSPTGGGIRRVPYTTDMTKDTLTYRSMDGNSGGNGEVHNIGEIWCSSLWDMTWNIIQQEGTINSNIYDANGGGGNTIALKLVIQAMKLQPCNPGFLDSRNAILAADSLLYNNRHKCSIWNAFARRGMGYSASEGSVWSTGDQVVAFDVPSNIILSKTSVPVVVPQGNQISYQLSATCECLAPLSGFNIRDTLPAGFSYISSTGGSLSGNIVSIPVNFSTSLQSNTYSVTVSANSGACSIDTAINDDRDAHTKGGLVSTQLINSVNWISSSSRSNSGTSSWFAADVNANSSFVLTSAPFTASSLSILSFWHYYYLENQFDGGRIEISSDGGINWIDAGPYIIQNNYSTTMAAAPWGAGSQTFSGNTTGFINTIINLSSFTGQSLMVRFHLETDNGNSSGQFDGWFVDDIIEMNGCGGMIKAGLYSGSNQLISSNMLPVFITAAIPLPLQLLYYTATEAGSIVRLDWVTFNELNTNEFRIERSTDDTHWEQLGKVAASGLSSGIYSFIDNHPQVGNNYYRLKMLDKDGKFSYSATRFVNFSITRNGFMIVPNPAVNKCTIYLNQPLNNPEVTIYDINGKLIKQFNSPGIINIYSINTEQFAGGSYIIELRGSGKAWYGKLSVVK